MRVTLYLKQHNSTGLLYFGKTTGSNVLKYHGSGRYWKRHLKKHGIDVTTLWYSSFDDIEDAKEFAVFFSEFHDIVGSEKFANEIIEDGVSGWPKGVKRGPTSLEQKQILSKLLSGSNNPMYGVTRDSKLMKQIGESGIIAQKKLRETDAEWAEKERQRHRDDWTTERKTEHLARFSGHAPAINTLTKEKLGLVSVDDIRWSTGEISSPGKGIKRGTSVAKGKPKQKLVCRLFDKKEMDLANFTKWTNKQ